MSGSADDHVLDPMAELQHRHRQLVHDAKYCLKTLEDALALAKNPDRDGFDRIRFVNNLRSLNGQLVNLVRQLEPEFLQDESER